MGKGDPLTLPLRGAGRVAASPQGRSRLRGRRNSRDHQSPGQGPATASHGLPASSRPQRVATWPSPPKGLAASPSRRKSQCRPQPSQPHPGLEPSCAPALPPPDHSALPGPVSPWPSTSSVTPSHADDLCRRAPPPTGDLKAQELSVRCHLTVRPGLSQSLATLPASPPGTSRCSAATWGPSGGGAHPGARSAAPRGC